MAQETRPLTDAEIAEIEEHTAEPLSVSLGRFNDNVILFLSRSSHVARFVPSEARAIAAELNRLADWIDKSKVN